MKVLTLARNYLSDRTIGVLFSDGIYLKTLERPWLDNQVSISCIPEGAYHVKRDKAGRFQYFAVQDVLGRTDIEFHQGNLVAHSQGCILVGKRLSRDLELVDSMDGINALLEYIGDNDFILNIRAATKDDA